MQKKLLPEAEQYVKQNTRRRGWRKVVQVMACIVVFCTTYALILPAITMEKTCELPEHVHDPNCYTQATTQQVSKLACPLQVHSHTEECGESCGYADFVVHTHDESCFDETGALVCTLPEIEVHEHGEDCWETAEAPHVHEESCYAASEEAHTHSDACYRVERGEQLCTAAEGEGAHSHGDACYVLTEVACQLEETEGYSHSDSCYEITTTMVCQQEEAEGHTHGDGCYETTTTMVCQLEETEDHIHGEGCTEEVSTLVCTQEESEGHTHDAGCTEEVRTLICDREETAGHTHSEACVQTVTELVCQLEESAGHQHEDVCYDLIQTLTCEIPEGEPEEPVLICEQEESSAETASTEATEPVLICEEEEIKLHSHEDECYETYTDEAGEEQKKLICTETVVEEHIHDESCFTMQEIPADTESLTCTETEAHVHGESCHDEAGELICTESTEGHVHTAMCYGTWELSCGLEEHAHTAECTPMLGLSDEDRTRVEEVIALIEPLPPYDEIMAKLDEFYEAEDTEGEEAYLTEVYAQVDAAYQAYTQLGEELQPYVTNADKLMELEFIWSRVTLEEAVVDDTANETSVDYQPLPYAAENATIHLFDYGEDINVHKAGQGFLPFYRIWPEYAYTVDGEASWDHDTTRPGYIDRYPPILQVKLGSNGYPVINRGADGSFGVGGVSTHVKAGTLQYLFDPNFDAEAFWTKAQWLSGVRQNVNFDSDYTQDADTLAPHFRRAYLPVSNSGEGTGLFQRDSEGYWYYNSALNAAWYNPETQKFELYDYTVIPGHEHFEQGNGNFLPFNKGHEEGVIDYQSDETLVHRNGIVRLDHIVSERPSGVTKDNFRLKTTNRTNAVNVNFGMTVEFDFYMPKDGKINGKDMVFEFSGDDDVWVYIDNVLVLDIGGCHDAQYGAINFATGRVTYPGDTAGYYNNETIKEMYTAAGVGTAAFTDNIFTDYSVHTLKFFYMERGGNVSNCYLRFNMPQIEKNTINVTKALEPDQKVDLLGSPDYYFSVLELNSNNQTKRLFIGPASNGVSSVTGITTYKVKNPDGSYVMDENGNIKIFTVEQYGIFSIKAGQTAVFENVPENAGNFYVQEMIKSQDYDQYPGFTVNHGTPQWKGEISWNNRTYYPGTGTIGPGGYTWYGVSGPTTNAGANSSFIFEQQNKVDTSKLAELSITKKLTAYNSASASRKYRINVEFDGKPLPVGTTYKVGSATRTVGIDAIGNSYVELAGGETAVISNILSGTQFRVWESEESAKGHTVTYSVTSQSNTENVSATASGVTGLIRVSGQVSIQVANTQHGTQLMIPVTKSFHSITGGPYTYGFTLTEMVKSGNSWTAGNTLATTNKSFSTAGPHSFNIASLTYLKHEFESLPSTKYYMIEETGETSPTVDNTMQYLVEVTIAENGNGITASITNILQRSSAQGTWEDKGASQVAFVNTLTGSLTVTKTVKGSSLSTSTTGFEFALTLASGNSGTTPGSFTAKKTVQNGTVTQETVTSTTYGFTLKHGESITFTGLPIGTKWTVTETAPGYLQSWSVAGVTKAGAGAGGNITITDTTAACTNTIGYELPQTGGTGTIPYTMAGLVLMIFGMAYLLYKSKARRREVI